MMNVRRERNDDANKNKDRITSKDKKDDEMFVLEEKKG